MRNLTAAHIRRLLKTSYFRIAAALMAAAGLFEIVMVWMDRRAGGGPPVFDSALASAAPLAALALAAVAPLYIGSEYGDGTMRNKIIAGHGRAAVYLSLLAATAIGGWLLAAVWSAAYLIPGAILLQAGHPFAVYVRMFLVIMLLLAAFAALFTFLSVTAGSRAGAAVVCLLVVFALMLQGTLVRARLEEPAYYIAYALDPADPGAGLREDTEVPNPGYLPEGSFRRALFEFFDEFMLGGQSIGLTEKLDDAAKMIAFDLIWIAAASGAGAALFRRRDLP